MQSWEMDLAEREVLLPPSEALVRACPANSSGRASCQLEEVWRSTKRCQTVACWIRKLPVGTAVPPLAEVSVCHRLGIHRSIGDATEALPFPARKTTASV